MKNKIRSFIFEIAEERKRAVNICLLGLGTTTLAIYDAIRDLSCCESVSYRQDGLIHRSVPRELYRQSADEGFENTDIIFASPSVRRESIKAPASTVITSDTDIFFREKHNHLFLVSGSDGKSTVTTLTSLLLSPTFPGHFICGKIGTPLASLTLPCDAFVLELSSFNLRYSAPLGGRAVLTNVTPNHLNWHADLEEYQSSKKRLTDFSDEAVLNLECPFSKGIAKEKRCFALTSDKLSHKEIKEQYDTCHTLTATPDAILLDGEPILRMRDVLKQEQHNIRNLMSAIALTLGYTSTEVIREVAMTFSGLEHRCEEFTLGGVAYIDSSIDTTPSRTATTVAGLGRRVRIILGGRGKGLDFDALKEPLICYADKIALYGEAKDELLKWIENHSELKKIHHQAFSRLKDAIEYADADIERGETLLLSPAATSYGEFADYRSRGLFFKDYINNKHKEI